jgi:hypothetical protein
LKIRGRRVSQRESDAGVVEKCEVALWEAQRARKRVALSLHLAPAFCRTGRIENSRVRLACRTEGLRAICTLNGAGALPQFVGVVSDRGFTTETLNWHAQFTVAPPQHFLYFFPDPHGHGSFLPTLEALRRGSGASTPRSTSRSFLKYS